MAISEQRNIIVIHLEDNALDAELTLEILHSAGLNCDIRRVYRFDEFQTLLQEYAEHKNFDMILADYNMPGFDGLTALRMTRQIDSDLPFILLSGALGEELAVELLRSGATDYVLKNNMQRLAPVVSRAIEEHQIRLRERTSQTEIRQARDEAQKANAAKSRFLGRISHELRTPLNAIIGYTQLMQSDPMSEEQEHCAEQILKAGEHLLQLINEVLDITRIESGVIPMTIVPTSITPVIERAVDLVRPLAREAQVTIAVDGGPCDLQALVDKDRLAQVLINLITNAVKYNRPHGNVFVECHEERSGHIKLIVRDNGIGIPPSKMERLFTPFDRLDLENNSSIPGTGLGLTVSKALVENMGGVLGVVSSENEGTIFWLEVPISLYPNDHNPAGTQQQTKEVLPFHDAPDKVLIVEDNNATADFMERVLRRRGNYQIRRASSLQETYELLNTDVPDLILIDLNLPDGNGESIISEIQNRSEWSGIPVVVLTADASPERREKVTNSGARAYFTKPLKVNLLLEEINALLKEDRLTDGV